MIKKRNVIFTKIRTKYRRSKRAAELVPLGCAQRASGPPFTHKVGVVESKEGLCIPHSEVPLETGTVTLVQGHHQPAVIPSENSGRGGNKYASSLSSPNLRSLVGAFHWPLSTRGKTREPTGTAGAEPSWGWSQVLLLNSFPDCYFHTWIHF